MSLMIGTKSQGATLVCDVAIDATADRLSVLRQQLANVDAWSVSAGTMVEVRDGAELIDITAEVSGPFSGAVSLAMSGGQNIASSPPIAVDAGAKAHVKFHISSAYNKDLALASAPPAVTTNKLLTAAMVASASMAAVPTHIMISSAAMSASATLGAQPVIFVP